MKLEMAKEGGKVAAKNDSENRLSETCTIGPEAEGCTTSARWGNVKLVICSTALALRAENRLTQTSSDCAL